MGRPIKDSFFGALTGSGQQIKVAFKTGGVSYTGYIVRARGSRKFLVHDQSSAVTAVCVLVTTSPTNNGEMTLKVSPHAGGTEWARKITMNYVYTYTGDNKYKWYVTGASTTLNSEANIETA